MKDQVQSFGEVAQGLARNPLGIIALFIVLVYGFAALVTAFAGAFTVEERTPLIYFLVLFPLIVLGVFAWLVSKHSGKLFAPGDFRNEENYVRMQLSAGASLAAATLSNQPNLGESDIRGIVDVVQHAIPTGAASPEKWRNHVLWVDDLPNNNIYEREALEAMGVTFDLALSTTEALEKLSGKRFAAIISDMGRREGPREGYVLLDTTRQKGDRTPFFIYAGSNAAEHKRETLQHGGQGCTNRAQELFQMVIRSVIGSEGIKDG